MTKKESNITADVIIKLWRENIERCIKSENYEAAAVWRDKIQERLKLLLNKAKNDIEQNDTTDNHEGNEL